MTPSPIHTILSLQGPGRLLRRHLPGDDPNFRRLLAEGARLYFLDLADGTTSCFAISESDAQHLGKTVSSFLHSLCTFVSKRYLFVPPLPRHPHDDPCIPNGDCMFDELISFGLTLSPMSVQPIVPEERPGVSDPLAAWLADIGDAQHLILRIPWTDVESGNPQHWVGIVLRQLDRLLGFGVHVQLAGNWGDDPRCLLLNVIRRS